MIPPGFEPYLILLLAAVLPTAFWRAAGVLVGRRISESSAFFEWVRFVATALLAGVVAKLLFDPTGALALVPWYGRFGGAAAALAGFFLSGRRQLVGIFAGEAVLLLSYFVR